MTKQEQLNFVNGLIEGIKKDIISNIETKNIPEEWNGVELRQYIADYFQTCCWKEMNRKRKKNYKNTLLIENLL